MLLVHMNPTTLLLHSHQAVGSRDFCSSVQQPIYTKTGATTIIIIGKPIWLPVGAATAPTLQHLHELLGARARDGAQVVHMVCHFKTIIRENRSFHRGESIASIIGLVPSPPRLPVAAFTTMTCKQNTPKTKSHMHATNPLSCSCLVIILD
mgnify:FL=1